MTQSNYRITCYFSTGSAHRMMWLQEAVRQTVVHRSVFVEEVVKCTGNNATNFTKIEAALSLEQMADLVYQAHAIEMNYLLKVFNATNSKNTKSICFRLGIPINLFHVLIYLF